MIKDNKEFKFWRWEDFLEMLKGFEILDIFFFKNMIIKYYFEFKLS